MSQRLLVINPNASLACTQGIAAALAPLPLPAGLRLEVTHLPDGPPAIANWEDWHAVALPLCRLVEREPAAAYVIECCRNSCAYLAATDHCLRVVAHSSYADCACY